MISSADAARNINSNAFIAHLENQDLYGVARLDSWQDLVQADEASWGVANRCYQQVFMHALSIEKLRKVTELECTDHEKLDIFYASSDIDALFKLLANEKDSQRKDAMQEILLVTAEFIDSHDLTVGGSRVDLAEYLGHRAKS